MAGFSDSPLEGTGYEEVVRTTGVVRDAFNLLFKLPHCRKSQARYQLQIVRTGVSTGKTQNISNSSINKRLLIHASKLHALT
ncbi:hypothetical protein J6590_097673 [Homalodisca vitripennis]|nr:hypothetical protein J6590_097673 [Homalodisca vitripennis]